MLTAALLLIASGPNCPVSLEPIAISVAPLKGEQIGGRADPAVPGQYGVGDFVYQGYGIVESSSDPRYDDILLDQRFGRRHRCGNSVSGPSGWNAREPDFSKWSVSISREPARKVAAPGAVAAEERGAKPILLGFVSGATWPVYVGSGRYFLGLMHAANGPRETVIVAFPDVPQPTPALVMAKLPLAFDTLSVVPDIHGPHSYLNLESIREGRRTQIVLRLDRGASLATFAKLSATAVTGE